MVLLSGGTDGGTISHVVELAEFIAAADPKPRFGIGFNLPVIFAGNRDATPEIERVLNAMEGVIETAAIAAPPPGGGPSLLVVYAVLEKAGQVQPEMQQVIRRELNPLFKIHEVVAVGELPRTASNKVMRRVLRETYRVEGGAGC